LKKIKKLISSGLDIHTSINNLSVLHCYGLSPINKTLKGDFKEVEDYRILPHEAECVQIPNTFGIDKVSIVEKVLWVQRWYNKLGSLYRWAEHPVGFLNAITDLYYKINENISQGIIELDKSMSVSQHLFYLTGNPKSAEMGNIISPLSAIELHLLYSKTVSTGSEFDIDLDNPLSLDGKMTSARTDFYSKINDSLEAKTKIKIGRSITKKGCIPTTYTSTNGSQLVAGLHETLSFVFSEDDFKEIYNKAFEEEAPGIIDVPNKLLVIGQGFEKITFKTLTGTIGRVYGKKEGERYFRSSSNDNPLVIMYSGTWRDFNINSRATAPVAVHANDSEYLLVLNDEFKEAAKLIEPNYNRGFLRSTMDEFCVEKRFYRTLVATDKLVMDKFRKENGLAHIYREMAKDVHRQQLKRMKAIKGVDLLKPHRNVDDINEESVFDDAKKCVAQFAMNNQKSNKNPAKLLFWAFELKRVLERYHRDSKANQYKEYCYMMKTAMKIDLKKLHQESMDIIESVTNKKDFYEIEYSQYALS